MIQSLIDAQREGLLSKRRAARLIYEQAEATNRLIRAQARALEASAENIERGNK